MASLQTELISLSTSANYRLPADVKLRLQQTSNLRYMPQNSDALSKICYLVALGKQPDARLPVTQEQKKLLDEKSPALRRYTCQVIAPIGMLAIISGAVFLKLLSTAGVHPYAKIATGAISALATFGAVIAWCPCRGKSDLMCNTDSEVAALYDEIITQINESSRDINMATFFRQNINIVNIRNQLKAAHVNAHVTKKIIGDMAAAISRTNEL